MISNITLNSSKETLLSQGDRVYLHGDTNYTGTLIRPVEGTYPPKWTIQLDRGGYEAVNIRDIKVFESISQEKFSELQSDFDRLDLHIPFSDAIEELDTSTLELEKEIAALKRENALLRQKQKELEQENELIKKDLEQAKQVIRRAKDISPLMRISLKRVLRLAHDACMDVQRTVGGWVLKMGSKARKFRRLADIWYLLSQDEFLLSEIFPEDKLIAIDLILPPHPRKRPTSPEKRTFPLMGPEDIIRNRSMLRVKSG